MLLVVPYRSRARAFGVAIYERAGRRVRLLTSIDGERPSVSGAILLRDDGSELHVVERRFDARGDEDRVVTIADGRIAVERRWRPMRR